jgi:hypothetical protein
MRGHILAERHDRLEEEFKLVFDGDGPLLPLLRCRGRRSRPQFGPAARLGRLGRLAIFLGKLLDRAAQLLEFTAEIRRLRLWRRR